jgi:hypothetical protein
MGSAAHTFGAGRGAVSDTETTRTTRVDGTLGRLRFEELAGVLRASPASSYLISTATDGPCL